MNNIIWFKDTRKEDVPLVGGKAANLGELTAAGIPVPPGFTVPASVYAKFIEANGIDALIAKTLDGLDVNDTTEVSRCSEVIKAAIMQAPMPGDVINDIAMAYQELGKGEYVYVAVRSSATAEDLPDASFAGQQDTFLNVFGPSDVVQKVQACWASLFNAEAICYRQEKGFDHRSVHLAAVVQWMVQAEVAGIAFSQDPVTNDPSVVDIAAAYGLGELAVGGNVTTDSYQVRKDNGEIVGHTVEPQDIMLVLQEDGQGNLTNQEIPVPAELADQPKLTDEQIRELARIVMTVESHYGRPQDVEWTLYRGKFYVVQARPITTTGIYQQVDIPVPPESAPLLASGQDASPGVVTGKAVVLAGPEDCHLVQEGDILVTDMTTPDFMPAMRKAGGFIARRGGKLSHAAIIARELGKPCVVGAYGVLDIVSTGQVITVDGSNGQVFDGVAEARLAWNEQRLAQLRDLQAAMANVQTRTNIYAILAEPELAAEVAAQNVDGVGLLRMEFILANIVRVHPRWCLNNGYSEWFIQQLMAGIGAFCEAFGDRPVVLRLTDFKTNELANLKGDPATTDLSVLLASEEGGNPYEPDEENPMMGVRGARRYMQEPDVFALEVEAIRRLRQKYKNLYVMVPFVRTPGELRWVLDFLASYELESAPDFKVWMMAEVPSNVFRIDEFLATGVDGVSIGSNDLTQLILGIDRDNERLHEVGNELDPAVMKAMRHIIQRSLAHDVTVGICGQGPSHHPSLAEELVRLGVTSMSVTPDRLADTRALVHKLEQQLNN